MKNNAILKAGNTNPTSGTKIAGKNAAVIFLFDKNFYLHGIMYNNKLYIKC